MNSSCHEHLPLQLRRAIAALWPELREPRIWVLWSVLVQNLSFKVCDMITGQVVQRVLLIWTCPDSVWDSLNVVADLLVNVSLDVCDLGILDAVLVAIVGVDLQPR